jgi:hypothetical protein
METVVRIFCRFKQPHPGAVFFSKRNNLIIRFIVASVFMASANPLLAEEQGDDSADPVHLENTEEEWSEVVDSIKGYSVSQREVAVKNAGIALKKLDERIDVLTQRTADEWDELSEETREARLAALRNLTAQRRELAEWYGGMKHSSSQAWVEVREGFVEAYGILQNAWVDALEEFE